MNNLNITNLEDLEDLQDILNTLIFEDKPSIFTEEYTLQFIETALHLMDETMTLNPRLIFENNLYNILLEDITDIFYVQLEEQIDDLYDGDDIEDTINDLLEEACSIFIASFYPDKYTELLKQFSEIDEVINDIDMIYDNEINNVKIIQEKINRLRSIPQPIQRTPEWYQFRWNLITASNAWKAFESQSAINQLIYEKCQPIKIFNEFGDIENIEEVKMVNINTPFHWGQKYEPLSVMIYEHMYNSTIEDFGCIQHPSYNFIGASPDGIVIESNTGRYGRMLEIKNPVSREITGIPKKEYWVQMQLQMEVCDLDECDFFETKFVEYSDHESYRDDSAIAYDLSGNEFKSYIRTNNNSYKGTIIYFHTKEGAPYYVYQPLNLYLIEDISIWEEETIEKYQSETYNYTFIKFIYWKIEKISCVLVLRNREWFKNNVGQLEKVWKIIKEERVTGYEHRAPNKKQKSENYKPYVKNTSEQGCFLFNKIIKTDS
jgi:putative phage-type endonuclease